MSFLMNGAKMLKGIINQHGAKTTFSAYPEGRTVSMENYNDFTAWFMNLLIIMNEN